MKRLLIIFVGVALSLATGIASAGPSISGTITPTHWQGSYSWAEADFGIIADTSNIIDAQSRAVTVKGTIGNLPENSDYWLEVGLVPKSVYDSPDWGFLPYIFNKGVTAYTEYDGTNFEVGLLKEQGDTDSIYVYPVINDGSISFSFTLTPSGSTGGSGMMTVDGTTAMSNASSTTLSYPQDLTESYLVAMVWVDSGNLDSVTVAADVVLLVDDDLADCPTAPYDAIQDAVDSSFTGDTIMVCTGTYAGAEVDKTLHFEAIGSVVVNDGPNSHSFLRAGFLFPPSGTGSGSTIRGFQFEGMPQSDYVDDGNLDFAIFSRGADNVVVEHNEMVNTLQAITNWNGSGWTIKYNKIEDLWVLCGGGIGILVGTNNGTQANNNLIEHNNIKADVSPDCGFYTTTGIVLYSNTRWSSTGGAIMGNKVLHNRSVVTGTWADPVEGTVPAGAGVEITDGSLICDYPFTCGGGPDVTGNTIAFNDFRGSSIPINYRPDPYAKDNNTLTRNKGKSSSCGHGITPASELFK